MVEQALLGGDDKAGAVHVERAAFENPVRREHLEPGIARQFRADLLVARHQVFAAPAVEAESPRFAPAVVAQHYKRPGIAQPHVAVFAAFERYRARNQRARPRFVRLIAHQQPHLLTAVCNRAGKCGDLSLRGVEKTRPLFAVMREADPKPVLRMPFGGEI